jgi:regulator of sigma D
MAKFKIAAVIFLLALALCFVNFIIIENVVKTARAYLAEIEKHKNDEEFEKAIEKCEKLNDYWDKKTKPLSIFIHHDTLDKINQTLKTMGASLENKSALESSKAETAASAYIKTLKESDEISIENIF